MIVEKLSLPVFARVYSVLEVKTRPFAGGHSTRERFIRSRPAAVQGFCGLQGRNVLITECAACCRVCSRQIMWLVEDCPACKSTFTGYAFYHMQSALKAIEHGQLRLVFDYFTEKVQAACFVIAHLPVPVNELALALLYMLL